MLNILNLGGSVASLWSVRSAGLVILALVIVVYLWRKRFREKVIEAIALVKSATSLGVAKLEMRSNKDNPKVAADYYESAKEQIVLTGLTLRTSFDQHRAPLKAALKRGIQLYIMMLNPDIEGIKDLTKIQERKILQDIQDVIELLCTDFFKDYLLDKRSLHIRFFDKLPPFTAIMIDGDILNPGDTARDDNAQIRVQTQTMYNSQHDGIILQIKKNSGGAFDYYANDLRLQWKNGLERSDLLVPKQVGKS